MIRGLALFVLLSFASADSAKQVYMNKLLQASRRLNNNNNQNNNNKNNNNNNEYQVNIANYKVKFEQCQFVKTFDNDLAQEQDSSTVLATKRFVLFRLCPNDCTSCNYNYGEYLVDLDTYLEATTQYFQDQQDNMCNACQNCQNDDQNQNNNNNKNRLLEQANYNVDCSTCYDECQKIANMQNNGYVDATKFLDCQMVYDPQDDSKGGLYAGPICASGGSKIKIGVFTDENCQFLDSSKDIDDYIMNNGVQMKLSHALLKNVYTDTCISCKYQQNNQNGNNQNGNNQNGNDGDQVSEMCGELYQASAKCEKTHGFDNGYANYYGYENQLAQESIVCDFMQSLKSGTYDESGEIVVSSSSKNSSKSGSATTGGQKFALTFFILGTVGLAVYAAMLHSKLVRGGKSDLSAHHGGAMA